MLQELSIRNLAIIDDLNINFFKGLTILSGETGAGKSIIINAINLLLGGRATSKLIRSGCESAEIEAFFHIDLNSNEAQIMKEQGLDPKEGLIVRRVISSNDRHKIYINGRLSTISVLTSLTENLASISGQHAHQGLLKEDQHLFILDKFGGLTPLRLKVYTLYHEIIPLIKKLQDLREKEKKQLAQIDFLKFQQNEISNISPVPGEDEELEKERILLANGEQLYNIMFESIEELYNSQGAVVERLVKVTKQVEKANEIDNNLEAHVNDLNEVVIRIEDIVEGLRSYLNGVQIDEKRLESVGERLDILNKLKRKYGADIESVLGHLDSIEKELESFETLSFQINEIEELLNTKKIELINQCNELSKKRKDKAKIFSDLVEKELAQLKMGSTKFQIHLDTIPVKDNKSKYLSFEDKSINETGIDQAKFLIAPNVGEKLKSLASIASGGELSRVVLALKAIGADTDSVATIVFDEVDAGIGGSVAELVGKKIEYLSKHHQVICITHLPQIAKFGNYHFKISKQITNGRTKTSILPLDNEERIQEIARMLGGLQMTKTTLDHAREMINQK